MAAERPNGPLDQSVSAFNQALEVSEERRDTANEAYILANHIVQNEGKFQFPVSAAREVGSYADDSSKETHYSRRLTYKDTPPIGVRVAGVTYNIFLRETREQNASERFTHRPQDKPGISMLASATDNSKRARLLFSFEEERTIGHEGTALDMPGTMQALEALQDFNLRLEEQQAVENPTVVASS